jgi:TPR repeat protein
LDPQVCHAYAQERVADCYHEGSGVDQDFTKAFFWYSKAAPQSQEARFSVATLMNAGQGVTKQPLRAFEQIRQLAEEGFSKAQFNMGVYYANGVVVPQDWKKAAYYNAKAAAQGSASAQHRMGIILADGRGMPVDRAQAAVWFRKAADQQHPEATHDLAIAYGEGRGVPQDFKKAGFWFSRAEALGHSLATRNLALLKDALHRRALGQTTAFYTASGICGSSSSSAAATAAAAAAKTQFLRRTTAQFPQCTEATLAVKYLRKFMFKHDNA